MVKRGACKGSSHTPHRRNKTSHHHHHHRRRQCGGGFSGPEHSPSVPSPHHASGGYLPSPFSERVFPLEAQGLSCRANIAQSLAGTWSVVPRCPPLSHRPDFPAQVSMHARKDLFTRHAQGKGDNIQHQSTAPAMCLTHTCTSSHVHMGWEVYSVIMHSRAGAQVRGCTQESAKTITKNGTAGILVQNLLPRADTRQQWSQEHLHGQTHTHTHTTCKHVHATHS